MVAWLEKGVRLNETGAGWWHCPELGIQMVSLQNEMTGYHVQLDDDGQTFYVGRGGV